MMDWLGKLIQLPHEFLNCSDGPGGGVIQVQWFTGRHIDNNVKHGMFVFQKLVFTNILLLFIQTLINGFNIGCLTFGVWLIFQLVLLFTEKNTRFK
jgi:hypothetical protein